MNTNLLIEAGRFKNAMRGFKYTSDELNQMDIDSQTRKSNRGKADTMKHKVYGIDNDLYQAYKDFSNIFLDNIFWGDVEKNDLERLKMLHRQIDNMFDKLRAIYPTQIKEDIGGAWWGFKNPDKDIEDLENDKEMTDRHFDSIDSTNEEIDKAIRLIDIMSKQLSEFIDKYSSYGGEKSRGRGDYQRGLESAQNFYDELNRYGDKLEDMKDEVGEKYWTRDTGESNESLRRRKVYVTERQLKECLNRAIRRSSRILRESHEEGFDADTDWRKEFMTWATDDHNHPSINVTGLMYEYYTEDNNDSFLELIEEFGDEIGKDLTDDSQESNWIIEEIRRAINEWGYYNCNDDNDEEYDEEGIL